MDIGFFSFIGFVLGAQKMSELIDKAGRSVWQGRGYIIIMVSHEHILMPVDGQ